SPGPTRMLASRTSRACMRNSRATSCGRKPACYRRFMKPLALLGVGLLVATIDAAQPARQPAADVARALQAKYDTIRDFSADFVHTYQGGALNKQLTERGTVLVKKP